MEGLIIPAIFLFVFPLLWCTVIILLSHVGGWATLVSHYGYTAPRKPPQRKFTSLSLLRLKFMPCNYSGIVSLAADNKALYISLMKIFAAGHTPLRIPYGDLSISEYRSGIFSTAQLRTAKTGNLRIVMRGKDLDWLESIAGKLTPNS